MRRFLSVAGAATVLLAASGAVAQTPDHTHPAGTDADHAHSHAMGPVDCTSLTAPPWLGLNDEDARRMAALQQAVADLSTPEAARAAGFFPALGNIPGMGTHYVHAGRTTAAIKIDEPHHLMFAPVNGQERLVGAAYAFMDVIDTQVPTPFDHELATWHDHPEVAPPGRTLHMLHVWFVPSSHGPFAGLNFWLPFQAFGMQPPNPCWLTDQADAERIQHLAFALAATSGSEVFTSLGDIRSFLASARGGANPQALVAASGTNTSAATVTRPVGPRAELLAALDAAARADDRPTWMAAAGRYLAGLTDAERATMDGLIGTLTHAQMSTQERDAGR